jgi:hypothetical protein
MRRRTKYERPLFPRRHLFFSTYSGMLPGVFSAPSWAREIRHSSDSSGRYILNLLISTRTAAAIDPEFLSWLWRTE